MLTNATFNHGGTYLNSLQVVVDGVVHRGWIVLADPFHHASIREHHLTQNKAE